MGTASHVLKDRRKAPPRSWWTRARVLAGLQRLYAETGLAPNCAGAPYLRLMRECGQHGLKGARRRYPPDDAVLRYWSNFSAAWREAGITPDGQRVLTSATGDGRRGWAGRHDVGERHGRLVVVAFAGYQEYPSGRRAVWLCLCDCGEERLVEAGYFNVKRECARCARRSGLARRRAREAAEREAAQRAAAGVQASAPSAPSSLAGAAGAPRATSPG